ncbi:dephospho-CoA kinase [Corynebacterium aquatimens]
MAFMIKIGLTGGIGSGKSTVAKLLAHEGFPVVDADLIAREIMEPGSPVLDEVAAEFGSDVLDDDGSLNRALLAQRAFSTKESTAKLNGITHPAIKAESRRRFAEYAAAGQAAVVYDMPLLVELGLDKEMDLVVVVDVDVEERVRRLVASRGLDESDARARIAQQATDEQRRAAADVVIDNNGDVDALEPQVNDLVARIRTES